MSSSLACKGNAPDTARTVIAYVECAISAHRYANWASPNLSVFGNEASQEVLIAAVCCVTVVHWDTNDLVTCPLGVIPRAVLRGKRVTVIFFGKVAARWIKQHFQ